MAERTLTCSTCDKTFQQVGPGRSASQCQTCKPRKPKAHKPPARFTTLCARCDKQFEWPGRGRVPTACPECRKRCNVEGCDTPPTRSIGFCHAHYKRSQKGADLTTPVRQWETGERKCKVEGCGETRIIRSADYCQHHYAEHSLPYFRLWRYGITPEKYAEMLATQGGRCEICGTDDPRGAEIALWSIDHDHACCPGSRSCGKCLRGLLCGTCNTGLGMFGDSIPVIESAATYLRHYAKE